MTPCAFDLLMNNLGIRGCAWPHRKRNGSRYVAPARIDGISVSFWANPHAYWIWRCLPTANSFFQSPSSYAPHPPNSYRIRTSTRHAKALLSYWESQKSTQWFKEHPLLKVPWLELGSNSLACKEGSREFMRLSVSLGHLRGLGKSIEGYTHAITKDEACLSSAIPVRLYGDGAEASSVRA